VVRTEDICHTGRVSSKKDPWGLLCLHQRSLHDLELAAWEGSLSFTKLNVILRNAINSACANCRMVLVCRFSPLHSENVQPLNGRERGTSSITKRDS
jgi:hypothetical protein